jgi:hypothetical protein
MIAPPVPTAPAATSISGTIARPTHSTMQSGEPGSASMLGTQRRLNNVVYFGLTAITSPVKSAMFASVRWPNDPAVSDAPTTATRRGLISRFRSRGVLHPSRVRFHLVYRAAASAGCHAQYRAIAPASTRRSVPVIIAAASDAKNATARP